MLTFLFWNLHRRDLRGHLAALVAEHDIDVLILAESDITPAELNTTLAQAGFSVSRARVRCQVAHRRATCRLKPISGRSRYAWYELTTSIGLDPLLMFALHAYSKQDADEPNALSFAHELARVLHTTERSRHKRTLLIGDFNMNPFEPAMLSTEGLHAVPSRDVAVRRSRKQAGEHHEMLFNPMWQLMGQPGAPGSFYFDHSRAVEYFWHTFDQVLLRPDLLPYWRDDSARFLTHTASGTLVDGQGRPDALHASDHLPLLFRLFPNPRTT